MGINTNVITRSAPWSRRGLLVGSSAVASAALLAACGGAGGPGKESGVSGKNTQTGLLSLWGSYGAREREVLLTYLNVFAQQYPGTTAEVQIYTNQDFMTKLIAALAGGTGPDFCRFKEYQGLDMLALGYGVELDGVVSKEKNLKLTDFTSQSVEGSRYRGKLAGIPHHHQFVLMGWNKTMLQAVGLKPDQGPETWDQLRDFARRLRKEADGVWGFRLYEISGKPREQHFNWFTEFVWRNGGEVFNKDETQVLLDKPEVVEAMQFMVDLMYRDRSTPTPKDPSPDPAKGQLAIWMPTAAGTIEGLQRSAPSLAYGLGPMPKQKLFATQMQHNTFSMLKVSKLQELTWKAIVFLASAQVAGRWQPEVATLPVRKGLFEQPPYATDPGYKAITDVMRMPGNRPKPHVLNWDEFTEETVSPYLLEAWAQQKSPRDALSEATRQANAWLARNRRK